MGKIKFCLPALSAILLLLLFAGSLSPVFSGADQPACRECCHHQMHQHECLSRDNHTDLTIGNSAQQMATCPSCGGTKECQVCGGSGTNNSGDDCSICNGSGKCYYCDGKGEI